MIFFKIFFNRTDKIFGVHIGVQRKKALKIKAFNECRASSIPVDRTTKKEIPSGVSFFVFYEFSTGIEGGSRFARAKRFAYDKVIKQDGARQRTPLITAERGAPLKAQCLDARTSLFRRYAPYAHYHKKGNPIGVSFFVFYEFSTGIEGGSRFARAKRFAYDRVKNKTV